MKKFFDPALKCLMQGGPLLVGGSIHPLLPLSVITTALAAIMYCAHQFETALRSIPGSTNLPQVRIVIFGCRLSKFAIVFILTAAFTQQLRNGIANGCLGNQYSARLIGS